MAISRRAFVKIGGLAAAGSVAAACSPDTQSYLKDLLNLKN